MDARAMIIEAEHKATQGHKRVLVVFGSNWCYDCHVLNEIFQRSEVASLLSDNYEVVHVDVRAGDKNQDVMKVCEVSMDQGIPAVAILESDGALLYSQKNGELENARRLTTESVTKFLNQWKIKRS